MPRIAIADTDLSFDCAPGESLLSAGLRAGLGLQYECNAGGCGACKVRLVSGEVATLWPESPSWTDADRRRGRVLGCQSVPVTDCVISTRENPLFRPLIRPARHTGTITAITPLTHDMSEIHVTTEGPAAFIPGQFAALTLPGGCRRVYSMSNLPNADGRWNFIVRNVPGGAASGILFSAGREGQEVVLDGPYGMAQLRDTGRDIICIAGGSGFAPILSIASGFATDPAFAERRLLFFYGGRKMRDLSFGKLLEPVAALSERIACFASLSDAGDEDAHWTGHRGFVHELVIEQVDAELANFEYYMAGPPAMIDAVTAALIERGQVPAEQLHYDRFY